MTFLDTVQAHISNLDKPTFYKYLAGAAGIFITLIGGILFFYYSSTGTGEQHLDELNEQRVEAKRLLDKAERVQKERAEVTKMLEDEPIFYIKEYIESVLEKVGINLLDNVNARGEVTVATTQDGYKENIATYQLSGISMRQLTEFLNELDQNKRVFTKEIDISKSKKIPRTIDVDIKIATMMPKETT